MTAPVSRRLTRDTRHKLVAGVCAGLARRFGLSRTMVRIAFVISCVLPGPQILAYLLLWVLMPGDNRH
jgi:phage shock protein PspC (stress-responsive transcriptional regulator)